MVVGSLNDRGRGADFLRRCRAVPWGAVGTIVLTFAVEMLLARHDLDFAKHWDWRVSGAESRRIARQCDFLALGDSQIKTGLIPAVFKENAEGHAQNLSVFGGQPASGFFLLRRAIASGGRPSSIAFSYHPALLEADPKLAADRWAALLDVRESLDLSMSANDPTLIAKILIERNVPSIRQRDLIRPVVLASLRGERSPWRYEAAALVRHLRRNHGAQINETNNDPILQPFSISQAPASAPWRCHTTNARYLERFLDLAASSQIRVFWILPPAHPTVDGRVGRSAQDSEFDKFVRGAVARHPEITVLDGRRSRYVAGAFVDSLHYNERGACALTRAVRDLISTSRAADRSPARGRWASLPTYSPEPATGILENLQQSRSIVLGRRPPRY
jgi:hypothetical protein